MNAAVKAKSPGMKRICTSCGNRFYDLNKRPIVCPSCSTEFTGDIKVKGRRGRLPAEAKKEGPVKEVVVENEEEILEDEDGIEVVSLDDAEDDADDADEDTIDLPDDLDVIPDFEDDLEDDLEEEEPILEEDED